MPTKNQNATIVTLQKKLTKMLGLLDEEGLRFLLEQAEIHVYNMNIIREQKEAAPVTKKGTNTKQIKTDFDIKKSSDGNTYHLVSNGKWKLFNDIEMLAMVQISKGKGTISEIAHRLYLWFEAERPDAFADLDLGDRFDPQYAKLVRTLKKNFVVRK